MSRKISALKIKPEKIASLLLHNFIQTSIRSNPKFFHRSEEIQSPYGLSVLIHRADIVLPIAD